MKKREILHEKVTYTDMRDLVERAGELYADRNAYSFKRKASQKEPTTVTFPEMRDAVRGLATEFLARGYKGKHIAVIGKNSYEWYCSYYAILIADAVIVPLDRDWAAADLADTVLKAECEVLVCDPELADKAAVICEKTGIKDVFYLAPVTEETEAEEEKAPVITIGDLTEAGKAKFAESSDVYFNNSIDVNKMSILVFTSGTTGKGKGVMLSQNNVLSDMTEVVQYVDFGKITVGVLPPHHTFGSSVMIVGHTIIGAEIYISSGLRYIQKELKEIKPEHMVLVPLYLETFYRKILANIKAQKKEKLFAVMTKISNFLCKLGIDLRKKLFKEVRAAFGGELKMAISGGAPLNREMVDFFEACGIGTLNGYGITECAPIISVNHTKNNVKGSVGFVLDVEDLKISEPNEDGEGEICVKGPNVMMGYYKDEEATAEAFDEDGYFKTGDYGKIGKKGALFITGRKKNLIILSNGKNVYPEEIENELNTVPGVLDIVVYEGQSKRGLQHNAIVAEIYPDAEYIEKNEITDIKAHLQPYVDAYNRTAVPYKKITVLKVRTEEFPKNTLRKIMRFKIDTTID
ncbi:MAG: AMP-binding protein [Clostridia bacterium]|nr:AMP-binding protein [Clostridia bacterium]